VVDQCYRWLGHLAKLKDSPDTVKTSFSGFRGDLHQQYLTMQLVLLGPASFGVAVYLRDYFQQATERQIDVEVIPCKDTDTAIDTFGNLMSSMLIYGDVDECQTLMGAFKGRKLIQPRGRFMPRKPKESEIDDSSSPPNVSLLESSSDERPATGGGGSKLPPCHLCGGETVYVGKVAGPWKKVDKGEFSGKPYWWLREQPQAVRL
jgi:hypothetical protein